MYMITFINLCTGEKVGGVVSTPIRIEYCNVGGVTSINNYKLLQILLFPMITICKFEKHRIKLFKFKRFSAAIKISKLREINGYAFTHPSMCTKIHCANEIKLLKKFYTIYDRYICKL